MAKGSVFERWVCNRLSQWWTKDLEEPRSDVFWRTGGSGGRAKTRGRKEKTTYGQDGDVCATDPIGDPLIRLITIEIKRGYNKFSIADLIDKSPDSAIQKYEEWINQAQESHFQSGSFSWAIILKRDRREALILMPLYLWEDLGLSTTSPYCQINFRSEGLPCQIVVLLLEDFLSRVDPHQIITLALEEQKRNGGA